MTSCSSSLYRETIAFASKRTAGCPLSRRFSLLTGLPPPAAFILPNQPCLYSSLSTTSITFSLSSLVATPEKAAASLSLFMTLILSTILAGRFFTAILGSLKKKVLPPTVILSIFSPPTVTLPSSATSIPGIFFSRSSSISLVPTRKAAALYSRVSPLTVIGSARAVIVAASMYSGFSSRLISPRSFS